MRALLLAASAGALVACGGTKGSGGPNAFPASPLVTLASDSGALTIAVRTAPDQPPVRGTSAAQYTVTDQAGAAVLGLGLNVFPWMPTMAMGSSLTPTISEKGGGVYEIDNLDLPMPGTWELRTDLSGPVTDHATPNVQVQ